MYSILCFVCCTLRSVFVCSSEKLPCNLRTANCAERRRVRTTRLSSARVVIGYCFSLHSMHRGCVVAAHRSCRRSHSWERRDAVVFARAAHFATRAAAQCSKSTTQPFLQTLYPISRPIPHSRNRSAAATYTYSDWVRMTRRTTACIRWKGRIRSTDPLCELANTE